LQSLTSSREFLSYWLPPLLGMTAILGLSGDLGASAHTLDLVKWLLSWVPFLSPARIPAIHDLLRKGGHVLTYGPLYFLWFRAFQGHLGLGGKRAFLWSLGLCLMVAMMDEGHQSLVPSRTGSFRDVGLDLGGATLGAVITPLFWSPPARGPFPRP
jgi:VanZ family protein